MEEHPTMLEIGAFHGNLTKIMSRHNPCGRILAIEANKEAIAVLRQNTVSMTNIEVINALIGPNNESVKFNLASSSILGGSPSTLSNNLESPESGLDLNYTQQTLESTTLSRFCQSHCPLLIELLVLDVVRLELEILAISGDALRRVNRIMLRNYYLKNTQAVNGSPNLMDYQKALTPYGFKLEFFVNNGKFFVFYRN